MPDVSLLDNSSEAKCACVSPLTPSSPEWGIAGALEGGCEGIAGRWASSKGNALMSDGGAISQGTATRGHSLRVTGSWNYQS
jgi:hypothetical protein